MLTVLYLMYLLFTRKETFFNFNRFYLLGILAVSLLFPILQYDSGSIQASSMQQPIEEVQKVRMSYYDALDDWISSNRNIDGNRTHSADPEFQQGKMVNWVQIGLTSLVVIYCLGVIFCLSRFLWSLIRIRQLIKIYPGEKLGGMYVIKVSKPIAPFSFLRYFFVNKDLLTNEDFDQILEHEKIHVKERHSIDLIFVQSVAAFFWFNPVIWQLINSLKTTHEYIADKQILDAGYSLVEYQTLLLNQLISNNSYGLVHNFNLSFIKKRITMMKNKQSGWPGKVKVAVALIVTGVFSLVLVQCNSMLDEQSEALQEDSDDLQGEINNVMIHGKEIQLPVLPDNGSKYHIEDPNDALLFDVFNNRLYIDGAPYESEDIAKVIQESGISEGGIVILRCDVNQEMSLVRDIQWELRKAERRKLLYEAKTPSGDKIGLPMLLPPADGFPDRNGKIIQAITVDVAEENGLELLKIDMGDNIGQMYQRIVYDFVKSHVQKQSSDYVVSAWYDDDDTFNDYLVSLHFINEGFNQIYRERTQRMYNRDFMKLDRNIPEDAEIYKEVRAGIPRAISIGQY